MRYYKIIDKDEIIGAINENNFVNYSPLVDLYVHATDNTGEYAVYKGHFYRSGWMQPIQDTFTSYKNVLILAIDEEEYNIILETLNKDETINVDWETVYPEEPEPYVDPIDELSIEFIRSSKLKEMSNACKKAIENGFDLMLSDGEIHHFSLTAQDQMNLLVISTKLDTQEKISYHADGELSKFYSAAEMKQIIDAANAHKEYHTTYYNALKAYINSLDTMEAIAAITYSTPIPEEFQSEVWKTMTGT